MVLEPIIVQAVVWMERIGDRYDPCDGSARSSSVFVMMVIERLRHQHARSDTLTVRPRHRDVPPYGATITAPSMQHATVNRRQPHLRGNGSTARGAGAESYTGVRTVVIAGDLL